MKKLISILSATILSLIGCGNSTNVAGGAEDVNTFVLTGVCVSPSGTAVPEATVQLIPSDYIEGESDAGGIISALSDTAGTYSLKAPVDGEYSIVIRSQDSLQQFVQFNIDSSSGERIDTLKPSGFVQFSLPDLYEPDADIVVPGTNFRYPVASLDIDTNNGILSAEIPLPENEYPELLYFDGINKADLSEDASFEVASNDTVDGKLGEVWVYMSDTEPVVHGTATAMFANSSSSLWIGTETGDLYQAVEYYKDDSTSQWQIRNYTSASGNITFDSIVAIDGDDSTILIACSDGIILYDGEIFSNITYQDTVVKDLVVNDVALLSDGTVVAAFNNAVGFYTENRWHITDSIAGSSMGAISTIDGISTKRIFASDAFGVFQYDLTDTTCSYVYKDDIQINDMIVTEDKIHLATDVGVVHLYKGEVFYASISKGANIASIAGDDHVMWAGSAQSEDLFALRKHSSYFNSINSPLKDTDIIAGVAFHSGTSFLATKEGILLSVQYKVIPK